MAAIWSHSPAVSPARWEGLNLASESPSGQPNRRDPLAPLRDRYFVFYAASRLCSAIAQTLLQAIIAWQVYQITGTALSLGILGLMKLVPALAVSLLGGAVADSYDRRRILMATQVPPLVSSAVLLLVTLHGPASVLLIYALVALLAISTSFENPARQSLLPLVVPREIFPGAVILTSSIQQIGFVIGPAVGGLIIAKVGLAGAYGAHIVLILGVLLSLVFVRARYDAHRRQRVNMTAIREGVGFVRHNQVLLGAMTLDMFAVIFGGATALLPIYATKILKAGAIGYGLLTSALPVGAVTMSIALVFLPPIQRTGRALLIAVTGFGLATMTFGLMRSLPLSLLAYALTGACDQVSVIMRQTTIQLATPDALRGRVSAISSIFVGASNQIGAIESGFVAAVTNAVFSVASGGLASVAVAAIVRTTMPKLWHYDIAQGPVFDVEVPPEAQPSEAL